MLGESFCLGSCEGIVVLSSVLLFSWVWYFFGGVKEVGSKREFRYFYLIFSKLSI